jgi:hypothetical protein
MMLFTLGLGWMIYWWTSGTFGHRAGLFALFLFAFSPTFLAHGRGGGVPVPVRRVARPGRV